MCEALSLECPSHGISPAPCPGPKECQRHPASVGAAQQRGRRAPRPHLRPVSVKASGAAARGWHRRPARPRLPTPAVAAVPVSSGDSSTCKTLSCSPVTGRPGYSSALLEPHNPVGVAQEKNDLEAKEGRAGWENTLERTEGSLRTSPLPFPAPAPILTLGLRPSPAALTTAASCKAKGEKRLLLFNSQKGPFTVPRVLY